MVETYFARHLNDLDISPVLAEEILERIQDYNRKAPLRSQKRLLKRGPAKVVLPPIEKPKKKIPDKQTRQEYFAEEKRKAEQTKERTKEWIKEQKLRDDKLKKKHLDQIHKLMSEQEQFEQKEKEESQAKFKERYYKQLEDMKTKKEEKKKAIQDLVDRGKDYQHVHKQPLFQIMEEKYKNEVELPQLEKKKEELFKLRQMHTPMHNYKLKEHMEWYNSLKTESNERIFRNSSARRIEDKVRNARNFTTSLGAKLYAEERIGVKTERQSQEKVNIFNRRNDYAKLVKDVHPPAIDANKQSEIQMRFEKKNLLQRKERELKQNSPWKPRKYPKNPLIPEPVAKREGHVVDYLSALRQERENKGISLKTDINWDNGNDVEKIKKISRQVEMKVKKHEVNVRNTPTNINLLKSDEEINDMLVSSIKAKLSYLEKVDD